MLSFFLNLLISLFYTLDCEVMSIAEDLMLFLHLTLFIIICIYVLNHNCFYNNSNRLLTIAKQLQTNQTGIQEKVLKKRKKDNDCVNSLFSNGYDL